MNLRNYFSVVLAALCCFTASAAGKIDSVASRQVSLFDFDWKFFKGDAVGAEQSGFDVREWQPVDLPHDWSIEGPFDQKNPGKMAFGYLPGGVGWYRKDFAVDFRESKKKLFLQFDGVYENSKVWLNGVLLGEHGYGFTSFQYELTPHLKFGATNTIVVRAENVNQPNCRWYSGSGIYRHVWLTTANPLHVAHWGTYITSPKVDAKEAVVRVRTKIQNDSDAARKFSLKTKIFEGKNEQSTGPTISESLAAGETKEFTQDCVVKNPQLWSPETPRLYTAVSRVVADGETLDEYTTPFGIRTAVFDKDRGFVLNSRSMKLKGVCLHNDGGAVGAAVPVGVWERRLTTLKEIGCNAIRCSHNPPAPEFLDLCDRLGFVVIDEAFDKWEGKVGAHFQSDWQQDLLSMLERDRNHPSIVLWSVGNENGGAWPPEYFEIYRKLADTVHQQEPTRPVTAALRPFAPPTNNPTKEGLMEKLVPMVSEEDVVSLNYQEQLYQDLRAANTNLIIIGSESYMYYRGDGIKYKSTNDNNPWFDVEKNDYVVGQFLWAGIDYLGESEGWPAKGWGASLMDTTGFRKDRSYWHQSVWSDKPMVHIAVFDDSIQDYPQKKMWDWPKLRSHWNFPGREKQSLKIVTYSNCDAVELFLNGESLGVKKPAEFKNRSALWEVAYKPGELKAVGIKNGKRFATWLLKTAGPAAKIVLIADKTTLTADRQDVVQIEARIEDAHGTLVPDATLPLSFAVNGDAKLIGLDNGDLRSNESFKGTMRNTYRGRCLAIVQAGKTTGKVNVVVTAPGLPKAGVKLSPMRRTDSVNF